MYKLYVDATVVLARRAFIYVFMFYESCDQHKRKLNSPYNLLKSNGINNNERFGYFVEKSCGRTNTDLQIIRLFIYTSSSQAGPEAYTSDAPQPRDFMCNPGSPLI